MNKLHEALKNEELMLEVGRKATEEQKAMTQSTVEERFDYEFPNGQVMDIGPESNGISWHLSKRQRQALKNFIKSELQLAEQKAREELKQTIIEKIEEYAKSQTDQHTKYAIMGCISLINEI